MSSLSKQEQLCQLIDEQQERIRQTFPAHRGSAVVALTSARDWHYLKLQDTLNAATKTATAHNSYLYTSGWHKALQLCFGNAAESPYVSPIVTDSTLDAWADQVLLECDRLTEGEQVLAHCQTGFMRMQQGGQKDFSVWIAGKKMPTEWREREDIEWWMNALAKTYEREMQELAVEKVSIQQQLDAFASQWQADVTVYRTTQEIDDYYMRLGMLRVKRMACHFLYPAQTLIGGCTVELFFFQAEDGIRDKLVTGVQTCALPISACSASRWASPPSGRPSTSPASSSSSRCRPRSSSMSRSACAARRRARSSSSSASPSSDRKSVV